MADSSHVDTIITTSTDSTGAVAISAVSTEVSESSSVDSVIVGGGIGPQGPIGLTGDQGDVGDKGDKGDPGTTDYNELINTPDLTLKADKTYVDTQDTSVASTAQSNLTAHTLNTANPHNVTKSQVGLSDVPNFDTTAAVANQHTHANKAVLDATTASFTTADEMKLDGIAAGAQVNTVTSVNTRTGVVVLDADDVSDAATTNKFVTAAEKTKLSNLSGTNTGDNLIIGTTTPTPSIGAQVLWLDTTGGNITLNLVTGE